MVFSFALNERNAHRRPVHGDRMAGLGVPVKLPRHRSPFRQRKDR